MSLAAGVRNKSRVSTLEDTRRSLGMGVRSLRVMVSRASALHHAASSATIELQASTALKFPQTRYTRPVG
jgi:hypothetical protein